METDAPVKPAKDDFHRERSRFLDAFAGLEEALVRRPGFQADERLSDVLKGLRSIRNDLVHSQLRFTQLEGQLHAVAINAQDATKVARPARLFRVGDFATLLTQIKMATRDLEAAA